jgi:hypothetical protein
MSKAVWFLQYYVRLMFRGMLEHLTDSPGVNSDSPRRLVVMSLRLVTDPVLTRSPETFGT